MEDEMKRIHIDARELLKEYADRKNTRSVAKLFGVSHTTIIRRLAEAGVSSALFRNKRTSKMTSEEATQYRLWSASVLKRDNYKCQVCGESDRPTPHHIETWKDSPDKRFDERNGITLCTPCHYITYKREREYAQIFHDLLLLAYDFPEQRTEVKAEVRPTKRRCIKCHKEKPIDHFVAHCLARWGVTNVCRFCHNTHCRKNAKKSNFSGWVSKPGNYEYRLMYLESVRIRKRIEQGLEPKTSKKAIAYGFMREDGTIDHARLCSFRRRKTIPRKWTP